MSLEYVILKRQDLYDRVWSKPMMHVANDLGVSSTRLRAACEQMGVPRPKQGHWTLGHLGRLPPRRRLPPLPIGKTEQVAVARPDVPRCPAPRTAGLVAPSVAAAEHPLVARTRQVLLATKIDERRLLTASGPCLSLRASPPQADRALSLYNAVLHHAGANGWEVNVEPRKGPRWGTGEPWVWRLSHATMIVIEGLSVEVSVEERVRLIRRRVTAADKATGDARFAYVEEVDEYHTTGDLVFAIHGLSRTGTRQNWIDGTKRIERQVPTIVQGIASARLTKLLVAEAAQAEARRHAEERRQRERDEQRRREDAAHAAELHKQTESLILLCDRHDQAERIRYLVAQARRRGDVEAWASWADSIAASLDPLGDVTQLLVPTVDPDKR